MGIRLADRMNTRSLGTFDEYFDGTVRQFEHLQDIRDAADFINIISRGLILGRRFLRGEHDALALLHCCFECFDRFRASHEQGNHHMRENDDIAKWQQR